MRIAIEGNIGAGKSECMAALAEEFPDLPCFPEPIDEWTALLDLFYKSPRKWAFAFALKVLMTFREPAKHNTCLVERSPLTTRHVFSHIQFSEGVLTGPEWELFKEYWDVLGWHPDAIVFVDTPPDICLERIERRGRACEAALDIHTLNRIAFQYENMLRFCDACPDTCRVLRVSGDQHPDAVKAQVTQAVRSLLRASR